MAKCVCGDLLVSHNDGDTPCIVEGCGCEKYTEEEMVSLLDANKDELGQMDRDNQNFGDYWCLRSGDYITIAEQRTGQPPTEMVRVPINTMRKIVGFLTNPQERKAQSATVTRDAESTELSGASK